MTTIDEIKDDYVDYLNFGSFSWKRPEGPPRVWRVIDGRRKMADGETPRFSIQEVPEELEKDVEEFMVKHFISREPISVDTGFGDDSLSVREFRTIWRHFLRQGVTLVALKISSDPAVKPVIAGVNILTISLLDEMEKKSSGRKQFKGEAMKKMMKTFADLESESALLKKFSVDRYLNAVGLAVDPFFSGQGLGEEILRTREDVGLAYQVPVSQSIFTSTIPQILVSRLGYEIIVEKKYSEIIDDEGNVAFPNVNVESIKVMAKRLYWSFPKYSEL